MNTLEVVEVINNKYSVTGIPAQVPFIGKTGSFTAELLETRIRVDNLGNQPFLPWAVFQEAICVLIRNRGKAVHGYAMKYGTGENGEFVLGFQ